MNLNGTPCILIYFRIPGKILHQFYITHFHATLTNIGIHEIFIHIKVFQNSFENLKLGLSVFVFEIQDIEKHRHIKF